MADKLEVSQTTNNSALLATEDVAALCRSYFDLETDLSDDADARRLDLALAILAHPDVGALDQRMTSAIHKFTEEHLTRVGAGQRRAIETAWALWRQRDRRPSRPLASLRSALRDAYGRDLADAPASSAVDPFATVQTMLCAGLVNKAFEVLPSGPAEHGDLAEELLAAHICRLAGQPEQALRRLGRLGTAAEQADDTAWEALAAKAALEGNVSPLIQLTQRGRRFYQPRYQLHALLWMAAAGSSQDLERLQTPRNIKRSPRFSAEDETVLAALLDVGDLVLRLAAAVSITPTLTDELAATSEGNHLLTEEERLLFFAAAGSLLGAKGAPRMASLLNGKYEAASLAASSGATNDVLSLGAMRQTMAEHGLLADARTLAVAKGTQRLLAVSKMSARIATVVISAKMRSAVASERRAAELRQQALIELGDIMTAGFADLRGGLMKMAQLSTHLRSDLPVELRSRLMRLTETSTSMPFEQVRLQIETSLGRPLTEAFDEFEPMPLAGGAIGQVHAATTKSGQRVAVKVKYDGIERAIRSDMKRLRTFAWLFDSLYTSHNSRYVIDGWEELLLKECDFVAEAANQRAFQRIVADLPDVVVPAVVEQLTGGNVLTSEFLVGESWGLGLQRASQEQRNAAGVCIVRALLTGMARDVFKYDVHDGNFLILGSRIGFVDFGATLAGTGVARRIFDLAVAYRGGDYSFIGEFLGGGGLIMDPARFDLDAEIALNRDLLLRPFIRDEVFRFEPDFARQVHVALTRQGKNLSITKFHKLYLPMARLYLSLYSQLADLGIEANWYRILAEIEERTAPSVPSAG